MLKGQEDKEGRWTREEREERGRSKQAGGRREERLTQCRASQRDRSPSLPRPSPLPGNATVPPMTCRCRDSRDPASRNLIGWVATALRNHVYTTTILVIDQSAKSVIIKKINIAIIFGCMLHYLTLTLDIWPWSLTFVVVGVSVLDEGESKVTDNVSLVSQCLDVVYEVWHQSHHPCSR